MANDNNIKNFTAADIEKYHKGQLSAKEMHELEKAALDDPFLADAVEGYSTPGINITADIIELKERLAGKTENAKVIAMHAGGSSSFPWLRAAVMIVLIAGAGLLAYQFLFKAGNNEIAQSSKAIEKDKTTEPINTVPQTNNKDSVSGNKTETSALFGKTEPVNETKEQKNQVADANGNDKAVKDSVIINFGSTATTAPTTSTTENVKEADYYKKLDQIAKQQDDAATAKGDIVAKDESKAKGLALKKPTINNTDGVVAMSEKAKEEVTVSSGYAIGKRSDNLYRNTNLFRGRVTDAYNNALPFANITNTRDNVGTYSDAQGNFTLVSTDTVLNVQVRSLGFENNNVQLRGLVNNNQVMLQEDRSLNARVLDTVKRSISRSRNNTMTLEEPEPADGWKSYESYVVNNLNIPETFDIKKTGETAGNTVEVSFEVNKYGDPVNIKVEKSLCDKCDKEAIRLIKEGPKWKRKAKKGKRTTVAVPFIKPD